MRWEPPGEEVEPPGCTEVSAVAVQGAEMHSPTTFVDLVIGRLSHDRSESLMPYARRTPWFVEPA
jgi:hypothetical protein